MRWSSPPSSEDGESSNDKDAARSFISRLSASCRLSFGSGRIRLEPAAGAARLMRARGSADEGARLG